MTSAERPADEMANVLTHALGLLLSVGGVAMLLPRISDRSHAVIAACLIYAASLIAVYLCSTLSHVFYEITWRRRYRTLDQACIFLLIAGTNTPFAVLYFSQGWWPLLLLILWMLAGLGVWRVWHVRDLSQFDKILYVLMGLLPVVGLGELYRLASSQVTLLLVAGGASYLLGLPFLGLSSKFRFAHAVWHVLVMLGSALHFSAIWLALGDTRVI